MIITLAGNIGIGKSTLAHLLHKETGAILIEESVDDNPLLDRFYEDKERWSFAIQMYFFERRLRDYKKAIDYSRKGYTVILDRSLYEDLVFSKVTYEDGGMSKEEYDIHMNLLKGVMEEFPKPHSLIYLHGSEETVLERITHRGRDYEQFKGNKELENYYRTLNKEYDVWIEKYQGSKVFIDVDETDTRTENLLQCLIQTLGIIKYKTPDDKSN